MFNVQAVYAIMIFTPLMVYGDINYMKNTRGDCDDGAYYVLEDAGNVSQSDCATKCEANSKCVGYSFKQTSCLLRKNIHLCPANKWSTTNGYAYYAKPLKLNFVLAKEASKNIYGTKLSADSMNKFCLQATADAKVTDKVVTEPCSNTPNQVFSLIPETIEFKDPIDPNKKTSMTLYQTKHLLTGLCLDIMEYDMDNNPIRLSNCNIEPEIYYPNYLVDNSSNLDKVEYFVLSYNITDDTFWMPNPAPTDRQGKVKNSSKNLRKKRLIFTSSNMGDIKAQYDPLYVTLSTKFSLKKSEIIP